MTSLFDFKEYLKTIRDHRKENHWDVCFEPEIDLTQFSCMSLIDVKNATIGRVSVSYKNISLQRNDIVNADITPDKSVFLERIDYDTCDFYGNNGGRKITFEDCKFHKCYFSFSDFNDVNFNNCTFESCSFSQAKFFRCIFDSSCKFYKMSISGGKTKFINTEINAVEFFNYVYKPFEEQPDKYKGADIHKESYLLAKSLVKLSRNILDSNQSSANDDLYYSALKNLYLKKLEERRLCNLKIISDINKKIKRKKQNVLQEKIKRKSLFGPIVWREHFYCLKFLRTLLNIKLFISLGLLMAGEGVFSGYSL